MAGHGGGSIGSDASGCVLPQTWQLLQQVLPKHARQRLQSRLSTLHHNLHCHHNLPYLTLKSIVTYFASCVGLVKVLPIDTRMVNLLPPAVSTGR